MLVGCTSPSLASTIRGSFHFFAAGPRRPFPSWVVRHLGFMPRLLATFSPSQYLPTCHGHFKLDRASPWFHAPMFSSNAFLLYPCHKDAQKAA